MKLQFIKAFVYSAAILLFCIGFTACEKHELDKDKGDGNNFFSYTKKDHEFLNFIISSLTKADESIAFTENFVDTYGLPYWDSSVDYNSNDLNSLIVPIVDTEYKDLVALYYLKYEDGLINTYILLNDQDDIAYNDTKYLINFFEKNLGLSISNQEIELSINSAESVINLKLVYHLIWYVIIGRK